MSFFKSEILQTKSVFMSFNASLTSSTVAKFTIRVSIVSNLLERISYFDCSIDSLDSKSESLEWSFSFSLSLMISFTRELSSLTLLLFDVTYESKAFA